MEQERFDDLVKTLAKPMPRRKMLLAMAGAVGAAMFGLRPGRALAVTCPSCQAPCFDPATGLGVCCAPGQLCDTYSGCVTVCTEVPKFCGCATGAYTCCSATACCCFGLIGEFSSEFCCTGGQVCSGTTCAACPAGQTNCNCTCVNTLTDNRNCGSCGNICGAGTFCCAGACIANCTPSDQCHVAGTCNPASGTCTNPPASNGTPCTGTNRCFQTYTCQAGVCTGSNPVVCTPSDQCHVAGTCAPETGTCSNPSAPDGTPCEGINPCFRTYTCQSGICTPSNPVQCPECQHCNFQTGTCTPIENGTACSSGTCCNGTCVNLATDPSNCGRCGNVCLEGQTCCSGTCVNLQTDSNNCGGCGIVCPPNTCRQGRCTFTRTVVVPARGGWVNTGINLYTIDSMTSTARGYWSPGPPQVTVSADGYGQPWPDNFLNRAEIGRCPPHIKTAHWAALVGYIGNSPPGLGSYCAQPGVAPEAQKVFVVGSYFHGVPPRAGELWLAMNDDAYSGFNSDNAGQLRVTITITR